ncbi:MAG: potassium/proton antiporter [Thermoleophilaceae bacterium]
MILITGALLAVAIGASLIAGRLRVPGLLLFLGLGMVIGGGGFGWIDLTDVHLARTVGVVALALILFEGGLAAGLDQVRPVLRAGVSLALAGTVVTAVVTGLAAKWIVGLSLLGGLLLGSIVGATDSAALFSVLRGSRLKRRLALTLELESGLNDPVAILLVVGVIDWIKQPGYGVFDLILLFGAQILVGTAVGLLVGSLGSRALRAVPRSGGGLYPVASIATAALSFGIADSLHGSGFLAVYLTGLSLGSARIPARRTIGEFHAGLSYVSEIVIFITLGLLVVPSKLGGVAFESLAIAAVLIFVARPLAVLIATRIGSYSLPEALLLGGAGLRGAVPIVLATYPVIRGVPGAERYFDIVFFVVLTSTLLQGLAFEPLARMLRQTADAPAVARPLMEVGTIRQLGAEVVEYPVGPDDAIAGRLVNELGLPREALVNVIVRRQEALLPRGSTTIQPLDRLHILVRERVRGEVEALFERWRTGPIGPEAVRVPTPRGRSPIYSVRAWSGDAAQPLSVGSLAVTRHLRTRRGEPGALVQLEDARYAITDGAVVAVGAPRQLFSYCRGRIRRAETEEARAWWQELAGVLSQHSMH